MSSFNRIERLALEGLDLARIARLVQLPSSDVKAELDRSPLWQERLLEKAEARRRRDDARRRLLQSDIGRAPSYLFLASKRDALGHVDWDSVKGFSPWSDEIDLALAAPVTKETATTLSSPVRAF